MFTAIRIKAASALVVFAIQPPPPPAAWAQAPGATQIVVGQDCAPRRADVAKGYAPTLEAEPIDASGGLDWVSAALGAAAGTGLMIVALTLAGTRRRHVQRV